MQRSRLFKKMTLCVCALFFATSAYSIIEQQQFSTHLRLVLKANSEALKVIRGPSKIRLETYNIDAFETMVGEITRLKLDPKYIKDIHFSKENFPSKPAAIIIQLAGPGIEVFNFYQSNEKREIVDLWINEDKVQRNVAAALKIEKIKEKKEKALKKRAKKDLKKKSSLNKVAKDSSNKGHDRKITNIKVKTKRESDQRGIRKLSKEYRGFRYGAAFFWDYGPLSPRLIDDINLKSKTPDFFYKIKNRELTKDKKEAHMQLSINLYRKEKWGLMNKSIRLYNERYGSDSNHELNEFLKANALLKSNIEKPNKGVVSSAINILEGILSSSEDFALQRAISRYVIQYAINKENYVKSLQVAKNLFVLSRKNYDPDMKEHSVNVILFSLANLKQLSKIQEFLEDKYVMDTIPRQRSLAYEIYVALRINKAEEVLSLYEKNKKSIEGKLLPSIMYNVAEANFRLSRYKAALKLYDQFAAEYSFFKEGSFARVRIALCYDLLEKDVKKIIELYRRAVDRSSIAKARYEAKTRFASMFLNRKKELTDKDHEKDIFLEASDDEREILDKNIKKLLWQVRLRHYVNSGRYREAMTYLESIPLQSLNPSERQSFMLDGSEILFGMMSTSYRSQDYPEVVRVWSLFNEQYTKNMRLNPIAHYMVADSYLKLGINKKFEQEVTLIKTINEKNIRKFPIWVERNTSLDREYVVKELSIKKNIQSGSYDKALEVIKSLKKIKGVGVNPAEYYTGKVFYLKKMYKQASQAYESLLLKDKIDMTSKAAGDSVVNYANSLFNLGDDQKLLRVIDALKFDTESNGLGQYVFERIRYLKIEALVRQKNTNFIKVEQLASSYIKEFESSENNYRVKYILALAKIKSNEIEGGKEILSGLLKDEKTPDYLKEMARSEMSMIELDNRSI